LGRKEYHPLKAFTIGEKAGGGDLLGMIGQTALPPRVRHYMRSLLPRLANSYTRKYYLSADKRFRLTVDTDIRFFQLGFFHPNFKGQYLDDQSIVVELKYSSSDKDDLDAGEVTNNFPFRVTKNSKYVGGVDRIYF
jgi:hypothetical protein